jgi:20S proteasome subunit beta 2
MQVYPHGSTDTLPFATMGSGSLAAMSVFESQYREGLTVSEPVQQFLDLTMLVI